MFPVYTCSHPECPKFGSSTNLNLDVQCITTTLDTTTRLDSDLSLPPVKLSLQFLVK
jgi:hypothetical protein